MITINRSGVSIFNNQGMVVKNATYAPTIVSGSYPVLYTSQSISTGAETTIITYANANADQNNYIANGDNDAIGQSFRSSGYLLSRVTFYGRAVGSPTGDTTARLYGHTGTFGTTGTPSGSVLATSDIITAASISTTAGPVTYTFSGDQQYYMPSGSIYVIAWYYTGGSTSNHIACEVDISAPTDPGRAYYLNGTTWTTTTQDPTGTSGATDDMTYILYGLPVTITTISPTLIDSYLITNRDSNITLGAGGNNIAYAQSFTGDGRKLYNVSMSMLKTGSPTGNLYCRIHKHTGTFGSTGVPDFIYYATSNTFDVSTLTTSNVSYAINFTGQEAITLGLSLIHI